MSIIEGMAWITIMACVVGLGLSLTFNVIVPAICALWRTIAR